MTGNPKIVCVYAADFLPTAPLTDAGVNYGVLPENDIEWVMRRVAKYALTVGGLDKLYIVCHCQDSGGFLQIGQPGINVWNVKDIGAVLKNKVKVIHLHCCFAANNPAFCRSLAAQSKATVYAYNVKVLAWPTLASIFSPIYFGG